MPPAISILLLLLSLVGCKDMTKMAPLFSREYHVSPTGSDANKGSRRHPFATIGAAAERAQPGDTITVHAGIYRERINPPRGGTSENQRITYRAAPGERVVIKGSEVIKGWQHVENDTWKVSLPNHFFGDYNPYVTRINGDWFEPLGGKDRIYHTGSVYLEGHWHKEAPDLQTVLSPAKGELLWFGRVEVDTTTLWAQFPGVEPNQALVEINVRETVFYPKKLGINYITVQGFILEQAAPNWAPPTAEQVGLIGTHWSKGWIIEKNTIRHSICAGLTLGKYGDAFDNQGATAEDHQAAVDRALANGWNRETVGSHIVRHNHISHCEQAGIVGSMAGAFSLIEGNIIHDINLRGMLGGHEMAGIKLHGPIDTVIRGNHVFRCGGSAGLWLDWMTQGTRVTRNLFHSNEKRDLFLEVNHGPFLIDHNIFLSKESILDWSQGGAYAHNLIAGVVRPKTEGKRRTPYFEPHSTRGIGIAGFTVGDERFINNWFVGPGNLDAYANEGDSIFSAGNIFQPDASVKLMERNGVFLIDLPQLPAKPIADERTTVTSSLLGKARVPNAPFVQPDGSPHDLVLDYFGNTHANPPLPGPFSTESLKSNPLPVTAGSWTGRRGDAD